MTPEVASGITGVDRELIVEAARVFGRAARGMAKTGTGPDMGPHANVAEHLVQAMNVVCGRFPREGDRYAGSRRAERSAQPARATVVADAHVGAGLPESHGRGHPHG